MPRKRSQKNTRIKVLYGEVNFSMSDPEFVEMLKPLDHYRTASEDFSPVFEEFSRYHLCSIQRNFAAQGRPRRWAPLARVTVLDRLRKGYGAGPILQRTRALWRGFRFSWRKTVYSVRNVQPYFNAHQFGYPPNNLPARPMLVLLRQDKAQFTRISRKHLAGRS